MGRLCPGCRCCDNQVWIQADEFGCELRISIDDPFGPANLQLEVSSFSPAQLAHAGKKARKQSLADRRRSTAEKAHSRRFRALRSCDEWGNRNACGTNQSDELATSHVGLAAL
jgi:hypothetical protein